MPEPKSDCHDTQAFFLKISRAIEGILLPADRALPFEPEVENADYIQVERGAVFGRFLIDPSKANEWAAAVERLIVVGIPATVGRLTVVDRAGHRRPVYRPLLVYAWLQAFRLGYEQIPRSEFGRWEEAGRIWCDQLESTLGAFTWPTGEIPASAGDQVAEVCWIALALHVAGKVFIRDAWTDLAGDVFGKLSSRQQASGAFLQSGVSDNIETLGFHELAILHSAASYAVQSEDRSLARRVSRATQFHQNEMQPDHSTHQPWGLFAFLWNCETRAMGETMLQTCMQTGTPTSGLTLMLLADALYCMRLFAI